MDHPGLAKMQAIFILTLSLTLTLILSLSLTPTLLGLPLQASEMSPKLRRDTNSLFHHHHHHYRHDYVCLMGHLFTSTALLPVFRRRLKELIDQRKLAREQAHRAMHYIVPYPWPPRSVNWCQAEGCVNGDQRRLMGLMAW